MSDLRGSCAVAFVVTMFIELASIERMRSALKSKHRSRQQTSIVVYFFTTSLYSDLFLGGLVYWITLPKVINKPFLLYGESCYMNSRSCDASRMLWCPAGTCLCRGDFAWDSATQNCSCPSQTTWTGFKCQGFGYFGDPCKTIPCRPTLTCAPVINQTFSTSQAICACDNATFLDTSVTTSRCIPRLGYGAICQTKFDCQGWLGLSCSGPSGGKVTLTRTDYSSSDSFSLYQRHNLQLWSKHVLEWIAVRQQ